MTSSANFTKINYLRTTRTFPADDKELIEELTKMYTEVAGGVNNRTVGVFPTLKPVQNGETWYMGGSSTKQNALRQVYPFTSAALTFAHGINFNEVYSFVRIFGTYTDGTNWFPIPDVDLEVTPTNIVISSISPTSGTVVLEWLTFV